MPQILYLNSVRFPLSLPWEDCSCKIHGLRVGITQASRGRTYPVHQPLPQSSLPPIGGLLGNVKEGEANIHAALQERRTRANASLSWGLDTRGGERRSPQWCIFINHPSVAGDKVTPRCSHVPGLLSRPSKLLARGGFLLFLSAEDLVPRSAGTKWL